MTIEQIILIIITGVGSVWALVAKVIIPAYIEQRRDTQEHLQSTESGAFKQVLMLNETLITTLIKNSDTGMRLDVHDEKLNDIEARLAINSDKLDKLIELLDTNRPAQQLKTTEPD